MLKQISPIIADSSTRRTLDAEGRSSHLKSHPASAVARRTRPQHDRRRELEEQDPERWDGMS